MRRIEALNPIQHLAVFRTDRQTVLGCASDDIKHVVLCNKYRCWCSKLRHLIEVFTILVKHLYTLVRAVGHVESTFRIHRNIVRKVKLAWSGTFRSPALYELAVF